MDRGNQHNIVIQQGDDWSKLLSVALPNGETLVGCTGRARICKSWNAEDLATPIADATVTIMPPLEVLIRLPRTITRNIPGNCNPSQVPDDWYTMDAAELGRKVKPYVWDFEIQFPNGGDNLSLLWGWVLVPVEVTRNA